MSTLTDVEVGTELPPLQVGADQPDHAGAVRRGIGRPQPDPHRPRRRAVGRADDVFAQGMLSMAYLGRLLTDWAPQQRLRSFRVRFAAITPVARQPTCTGTVVAVDEVEGERRATVELAVTLADGTVTLTGDAVVALS